MNYFWDYLNPKAYNNRVGKYKLETEIDFILRHAQDRSSILDVAGGSGRCALSLIDEFQEITIIDINQEAIELLQKRNNAINAICGDFMQAKFDRAFPTVICIESLGYFTELDYFFKKINQLTAPQGVFMFTLTNPNSWRYFVRRLNYWKETPTRYNNVSLGVVKQQLVNAGFDIVSIKGMNWLPFPYASNSRFIPIFVKLERILKLDKWHAQSPWLLVCATKK